MTPWSKAARDFGRNRKYEENMENLASGLKLLAKKPTHEAVTWLKNFNSNIPTLDTTFKNLKPEARNGFLTLNNATIGKVNQMFRGGNLKGLIDLSRMKVPFKSTDQVMFKKLLPNFPEKTLHNMNEVAKKSKSLYSDLNLKKIDFNAMPKKSQNKLRKVLGNMEKHIPSLKTALLVGGVAAGAVWLNEQSKKRAGCFMIQSTGDGKIKSCKVKNYSCLNNEGEGCPETLTYYNVTLVLMTIAQLPDTNTVKTGLALKIGVTLSDLNSQLADVLKNHFAAVSEYVAGIKKSLPTVKTCVIKHGAIESGEIPKCRMCDPTAEPTSTQYIDPEQLNDETTFECRDNPGIIDTLVDYAESLGINIWEGVDTISGSLKIIGIIAAVVAVLVLLIIIAKKFMPTRNDSSKYERFSDKKLLTAQK